MEKPMFSVGKCGFLGYKSQNVEFWLKVEAQWKKMFVSRQLFYKTTTNIFPFHVIQKI